MNPQTAYTQWSATYDIDRNLTRDLDAQVTRQLLADRRYGSILELGCGTGKNTAWFKEVGDHVLALDFSEGMIRQAQQKTQGGKVIFALADLTQVWPCQANTADLLTCNLVLEHIRDLAPIFAEARRALRAGGRFFVSELHPFRQYQGTVANFKQDQGAVPIQAFVHHISDFVEAGEGNGLRLATLREWWPAEDEGKPPRLVSLLFEKL